MASSDARSGLNTGLPDLPVGQNEQNFQLLAPVYQAINGLAAQVSKLLGVSSYPSSAFSSLPPRETLYSGQNSVVYATAAELLSFGDPIHFIISGGILQAQKAAAANASKPCQGICAQVGGMSPGAAGKILLGPCYMPLSTTGTPQFYLAPGGGFTALRPSGAGQIIQALGFGLDTNGIWFNPSSLFIQL